MAELKSIELRAKSFLRPMLYALSSTLFIIGEMLVQEEQKERQEGPTEEIEEPSTAEEEELVEEGKEEVESFEAAEGGEFIQRRGCLRGCLTPIAVVLIIILAVIMIGYTKRGALHEGLLKRIVVNTQNRVLKELPEGMDGKSVESVFEEVKIALKEDRIDEEALVETIEEYQDAVRKMPPQEQKKQEINKLLENLNAAIIGRNQ